MDFIRTAGIAALLGLSTARADPSPPSTGNESVCFERGVDYKGYDILTLSGVASPALCMESCGQTLHCGFWSWNPDTNICYLKSTAALLGRTEAEGVISGPRSCYTHRSCFLEGVDYVGYDLNRIEGQDIPSAEACQELCLGDPRCAFFSYKVSVRGCYLKSAAAPVGRTIDEDVISGPRICAGGEDDGGDGGEDGGENPPGGSDPDINPGLPVESCAEGGVEYRGKDVDVQRDVRSAAHCQQICAANLACYYWTWDKNKKTCSQKDAQAIDNKVSGKHTLGKVSAAKDCLPINPGCHSLDTTFLGSVLKQIRTCITFEACQHNCQNESSCHYFTWDSRSQTCQLRDASPYGYVSDSSTVGVVSGPKYCPNDDVCIEQADYVGHDLEAIEDGRVPSAVECRNICRRTEGCEFWTWVKAAKNCYLKTEDALLGKTNGLASIGRYSGPRECFMLYGCLEPNTAYLSSNSTQFKDVATYKDCESRCIKHGACTRWTYITSSKVCIITKKTDTLEKVPMDGAVSGSDCQRSADSAQTKCLTPGVRYKSSEMSFIATARDVGDCHFECINTALCRAFTFEEGAGCYLYDREPSALTQHTVTYPTAVSGVPQCGEAVEGENNTCYVSNAIPGGSFYAYSFAECEDACTAVPSCKHFTYNPKRRADSCMFFSAGASKDSNCPGSTSGSKIKQAAIYDFHRYEAPSVSIPNVESFDACQIQCAQRNMAYWTYYAKEKICHLHEEGNYRRVSDELAICGTVEDPRA